MKIAFSLAVAVKVTSPPAFTLSVAGSTVPRARSLEEAVTSNSFFSKTAVHSEASWTLVNFRTDSVTLTSADPFFQPLKIAFSLAVAVKVTSPPAFTLSVAGSTVPRARSLEEAVTSNSFFSKTAVHSEASWTLVNFRTDSVTLTSADPFFQPLKIAFSLAAAVKVASPPAFTLSVAGSTVPKVSLLETAFKV